ncbi:SRSO17 transposase [Amycolatopsis jiangsuensis]|uniref:SRSO17 transposase n=3 Tax=Amycolatopsis jiangsuensis TaxID=1181879 RepID=A0A840J881_9PSEU|nr:IS701 family transposase [Amycolatopsis jiangsuensis]MBB4685542.1 SRSO17 transposase [Amycolatopsis jiangsuensis]MBB4689684.1 SRSO17 transposase [Amycolatopsis jiangsuensis]
MDEVRPVIEQFAERMFGGFARRDQRGKGELYLRGLMLDGKRKSMQPMAQRLEVDHQQLQQFVTTSTWEHVEVRRRLTGWAGEFIAPDALVIDDTGFPKDGKDSPGVARMYCGALGKTGNCQVGVSVHAVTDWASAAIDWRLFLPESWDDEKATDGGAAAEIRRRRVRSAIPDELRHREKWRLALDMLDEVIGEWGLPSRPVVADAGYGDATEFRLGLTERGLTYALAVSPTATAHPAEAAPVTPAWKGTGRPPQPRYPDPPQDLKSLAMAAGRSAGRYVLWRHGSRKTPGNPTASMRSRFLALRIRPANRNIPRDSDGSLPECWLLAEWPPGAPEPTDYWLSTLPADTKLRDLVRLAKIRWRIEHDYRELKDGLGLDHFEGRSWLGWHRHVTLAAVAQAICTQLRRTPKAPAQA